MDVCMRTPVFQCRLMDFIKETEGCFNSGYHMASDMEWKTYDDLRSSEMQFTVGSNNALYFPQSHFILLFLTEKRLGHQLPWNALSSQCSSVCSWILVYDHRRHTILSLHWPLALKQYPRDHFNSSHNESLWSQDTKSPFRPAFPQSFLCILSVSLCTTSRFYTGIRM